MEYFITKEQFTTATQAWKQQSTATPALHIIYNILRAHPLDLGFTPIKETSLDKIRSNYHDRWNGFNMALRAASNLLHIRDTSVEYYLTKYATTKKASMFGKMIGQTDQVALPEYAEDRRQREIKKNEQNKATFLKYFGLELTEELATRLLEGMKDREKK